MEVSQSHLLLKRAVNIKVIVTSRWKEEVQEQLQTQINQLDGQLQQMVAEMQKQGSQSSDPMVMQQISNVQVQVNQKKSEILEKKNQILQQLQQVQLLEMDQEVGQGQIEGFFRVETGDNLISKMQVEVLLRDGIVQEIRGDL
jgi:Skp family chaperone for outer membrane proteins